MSNRAFSISLVIATRGNPTKLERLLLSLKSTGILKLSDVETIIVDNNNDQKISYQIKETCTKLGVIYLLEKYKGKSYAINKGILVSRGDYIAFTDDGIVVADKYWLYKLRSHLEDDKTLGYISGNVKALTEKNSCEKLWEKKGGLSKGGYDKVWDRSFLNKFVYKFIPWQFNKICAGANSMIPKSVIKIVGPYNILLDSGTGPGAGGTIEIGYRIAKAGYCLQYDSRVVVYHEHPNNQKDVRKKLFTYGKGDVAYQMSNFLEFGDWRCLWWSIFGHSLYTWTKVIKSLFGYYPLSIPDLFWGLAGNWTGWIIFLYVYFIEGGKDSWHQYKQLFLQKINE